MSIRDLFPGHYRPTEDEIRNAWVNALIVPDANVLLHFYRYSPKAKAALRTVLEKLRARLWVPYQVAEEFHRNRLAVIQKQAGAYSEFGKEAQKLFETLRSPHKHPFLNEPAQSRMESMLEDLTQLLREGETETAKLLVQDPILSELAVLLEGAVGVEPSAEQLDFLRKEAKRRIGDGIPPGTCESKDETRTLGDAILWQQLLAQAKTVEKSVIMVTDDAKEDWWTIVRGQQLGPRPELVKEFLRETKQRFFLYSAPRFIEKASEFLGLPADKAAIESARSLSLSRAARRRRPKSESEYLSQLARHANVHATEIQEYLDVLNQLSPQQWEQINHPMNLPPEIVERLPDLNNRCRCVVRIAHDVGNVQAPTFSAFGSDMYKSAPRRGAELVTALSRIPAKWIDLSTTVGRRRKQ